MKKILHRIGSIAVILVFFAVLIAVYWPTDTSRNSFIDHDNGYDITYTVKNTVKTLYLYPKPNNSFFHYDSSKLQGIKIINQAEKIEIHVIGYPTSAYCSGAITLDSTGSWRYQPYLVTEAVKPHVVFTDAELQHVLSLMSAAKKAVQPVVNFPMG